MSYHAVARAHCLTQVESIYLSQIEMAESSAAALAALCIREANEANATPADPSLETFCVTTAINYCNGAPHLGHAYEAVAADVLARYHRAYGRDVLFMTGSDEHGQKIAETAAAAGVTPLALCDSFVARFQDLNTRLCVSADLYNRTTSAKHKACAQEVFRRSLQSKDIYLGTYEGWYNVREEAFVTESEAAASDYKDPTSGKPLKKMAESSYFFRQSRFQAQLIAYILDNPAFVQPEARRNDILSRLQREPLLDLSISRTTFGWGIPVPGDERHVMYVWFDALTNYLTGCDWPEGPNARFWPASVHIIGKDITWFHCVIWPCMLWSAGLPLPARVFGHGFVTAADGQKMSKSIGNVVDPFDVLALCRGSSDTFRYYLMRGAVFGSDVPYSPDALKLMHNADLSDTLGNLVHRTASLCAQTCGGTVPNVPGDVVFDVVQLRAQTEAAFASLSMQAACEAVINAAKDTNKYLTERAPWNMKGDPNGQAIVVRSILEAVFVLAHFLSPFIPTAASAIFEQLSTAPRPIWSLGAGFDLLAPGTCIKGGGKSVAKDGEQDGAANAEDGGKKGHKKREKGQKIENILFEKFVDDPPPAGQFTNAVPAVVKPVGRTARIVAPAADAPLDASRLEIRVGRVTRVQRHPDADTLFVETIDLGEAAPRTVVSGLVKFMSEEQLLGARVLCLCNLKPAAMRGVVSAAMVLAASNADHTQVELVTPPDGAHVGELVSFTGFPGAPDDQLHPKKKVWEALQPDLHTDNDGVAFFRDAAFMTTAGPCRVATIKGGAIR